MSTSEHCGGMIKVAPVDMPRCVCGKVLEMTKGSSEWPQHGV